MQCQMLGGLIGAVLGVAVAVLIAYTYAIHVIKPKLVAVFKGIVPTDQDLSKLSPAEQFMIGANAAAREQGDTQPFADPVADKADYRSSVATLEEAKRLFGEAKRLVAEGGSPADWPIKLAADDRKLIDLAIALDHHQNELRKRCGCAYCVPLVAAARTAIGGGP